MFNFTRFTFRQNRFAIDSYIIAKIFNPSKCWTVTIQLVLNDALFLKSVLVLFLASFVVRLLFVSMLFFDLVFFYAVLYVGFDSLFSVQIIQNMFCPDPGNVFQVFRSC